MNPLVADISDAVAALIQAAALSQPFAVERTWLDVVSRDRLKESDPIAVAVLPGALTAMAFDLGGRVAATWEVGVSILRAVQLTNEAIDPVGGFVEEVVFLLAGRRQLATPAGRLVQCVGVELRPAVDQEQLVEQRLYRALIAASYRVTR